MKVMFPVIEVRMCDDFLHSQSLLLLLHGLLPVVVPDVVLTAGHHRGLTEPDDDGQERNVDLGSAVGRRHDHHRVAAQQSGRAPVELVPTVEEGAVPRELWK